MPESSSRWRQRSVTGRVRVRLRFAIPCLLLAAALGGPATPAAADAPVEGTLHAVHADEFDEGTAATAYSVDGVTLLPTEVPQAPDGARVSVDGERTDGAVVGRVSTQVEAAPPLAQRKVAVVLVNFVSDTRQPWTPDQARGQVFTNSGSANAFFREQSWDQVSLTGKLRSDGDVYGWVTIDSSTASCQISSWASAARQAVTAAGGDLSGYHHVMYAFPEQSSCDFAGAATVGGSLIWLNGDLTAHTTVHELGHNMLLHHANTYSCTSGGAPVTLSENCTEQEYGDRFDAMGGYSPRHNHGWNLEKLGYLAASNVQTVTSSGSYTVRSALTQTAEPTTLRIPRARAADGSVLDWYYLELRQSGGVFDAFAAGDPVTQGLSIRLDPDPSEVAMSRLLDATPGSWNGFRDAALPVGGTFSDGSITISTTSVANGLAAVTVDFARASDTAPPSTPSGLRASVVGGRVTLEWSPSVDDDAVAGYTVYRDGSPVATTPMTRFEDAAAAPGGHAYRVDAVDPAGNHSPPSPVITVNVPFPQGAPAQAVNVPVPPSRQARRATPPKVTASGTCRRSGGKSRLAVRATATGDRVVRMELLVRARVRKTVSGPRLRASLGGCPRSGVVVRAKTASGERASAAVMAVRRAGRRR